MMAWLLVVVLAATVVVLCVLLWRAVGERDGWRDAWEYSAHRAEGLQALVEAQELQIADLRRGFDREL